jgi:hypothetical protein
MTQHFDEFSKTLAESCSRRQSLRAFGALVAGVALSRFPLGLAWAGTSNACKTFCSRCPSKLRSQCLSACEACGGKTNRLCGSCGSYACCRAGTTCCGNYCADLGSDFYNCGTCGYVCEPPGPNEYGACIDGQCEYVCAQGAIPCNGVCTFLDSDRNNCGACGKVCGGSTPDCRQGVCTCYGAICNGKCIDLQRDPYNCGACGNVCPTTAPVCDGGMCRASTCQGYCPEWWCGGDGCGGVCACPDGTYCDGNWCYPACTPDHPYYPNC